MNPHNELINFTLALRGYYEPNNRVGLLLDELINDLRANQPREEIMRDAADLQAELGDCTATRTIDTIAGALSA